jgi:hypothetical protein
MENDERIGRLIGEMLGCIFIGIVWHILFWYFIVPELPYAFTGVFGNTVITDDSFPYTSRDTLNYLPSIYQKLYFLGYAVLWAIGLIGSRLYDFFNDGWG